ncbi:MAG: hypothetical protein M3162_08260 [Thermoproteota archaeon]|nr:hypothetical protein [Thermoproteota archaeon]
MAISPGYPQPLLIYDDKCSSCTKFARAASILSRQWIRIAGHYYSKEAMDIKKMVFPSYYDPTKMFWLINKKTAYGARAGLLQVIKEIFVGNYKSMLKNSYTKTLEVDEGIDCNYLNNKSCTSTKGSILRMIQMMKNSEIFRF